MPYLDLTKTTNTSISNLRISYADQGVAVPAAGRLDVWDCQFVTNNSAVMNLAGGDDWFHNVLFSGCGSAVNASNVTFTIEAEQITASVANFWRSPGSPASLTLTNSIILGTIGNVSSSQNTFINPDPTNFQAVGAGSYYLAANSSLHQAGTPNISPRLLAAFQNKTTYPPLAFAPFMTNSGTLTLLPQAQRDTNGTPDVGYHYDALDYTVANMVLAGGSITVEPGTVIGSCAGNILQSGPCAFIGFDLQNGSTFTSVGTPNKPNVFVDVQSVQEQFQWPILATFVPDYFPSGDPNMADPPVLNFRFSSFYVNFCGYSALPPVFDGEPSDHFWAGISWYSGYEWSYDSAMYLILQDCKVQGGAIDLGLPDNPDWGIGYFDYDQVYGAGAVSWINNSFENVGINLQPTYYPYGLDDPGTLNVDMTFVATNNLFKGGNWFILEPIPASGGNWVFENNLFDKVDILQDTTMPLDYAYNGYWPMTATELMWGGDAGELQANTYSPSDNFNDGQGEVILTNAPPYQAGPFGNFYLPTNTALYGAGSDTPANLGFFHYTTRLDQVKEGNEPAPHNINIGVHYIAATNPQPSTLNYQPIDTDGDGIPDYVENWHGDGAYTNHTDTETDWQNPTTATDPTTGNPIPDAYNSVYDNVDFSGDGLVGRIKKALGMSPFDLSNPLTLTQVVTGDEPDVVTFKVPISYDLLTQVGVPSLHLSGTEAIVEDFCRANDGKTLLVWNTDYQLAGQYYLQAQLVLNGVGDDTAVLIGQGPGTLFTSSNSLLFFESDSLFDDNGAYLDAQLPPQYSGQNVTYTIEIKDPSTSPPSHVTTITGSTSSGQIQEDWVGSYYDDGKTVYSGDTVTATFNVTFPDNTVATSTKTLTRAVSNEQGDGFDFAYMYTPTNSYGPLLWDFGYYDGFYGYIWFAMLDPVCTLLTPREASGGSDSPDYYTSGFNRYNDQDFAGSIGDPGYLEIRDDVTDPGNGLFKDMTNGVTKNFYCNAHGTATEMTASQFGFQPMARIKSSEVADRLGNHYYPPNGRNGGLHPSNPYRFVFLDGCETMSLSWRRAFGIFPKWARNWAARHYHVKEQAFVGWKRKMTMWLAGSYDPQTHALRYNESVDVAWSYGRTLGNDFYYDWIYGATLAQCLNHAVSPNDGNCPLSVPYYQGKIITVFGVGPWGTYRHEELVPWTSDICVVGHSGLTRHGVQEKMDGFYPDPDDHP